MLSIIYLFYPLEFGSAYTQIGEEAFVLQSSTIILLLALGLIVNILVEARVLKLFYKAVTTRKLLKVSAAMNIVSYVIVVLNLIFMIG